MLTERAYCYRRAMARTQTMVQLSDELIELLDTVATRRGTSRSALVRELVVDGLREEREAATGARIVAGYRRIPQTEPDEWGDPAASANVAAEELLVRLDAEERAGGHGPW